METIPVVVCFSRSDTGWTAELDALLDLNDGDGDLRAEVNGTTFPECKASVEQLVQRLSAEHGRPTKVAYLEDSRQLESAIRHVLSAVVIERHGELTRAT